MGKTNCWEAKKCGREKGGDKCGELGVCPASSADAMDAVHGGRGAGRACWAVVGTLCGGKVQGTFAMKQAHCEDCDFYKRVRAEEGTNFVLTPLLLRRLRESGGSAASANRA